MNLVHQKYVAKYLQLSTHNCQLIEIFCGLLDNSILSLYAFICTYPSAEVRCLCDENSFVSSLRIQFHAISLLFVCLFVNFAVVIFLLLLLSGDVELNPGPTSSKRSIPTNTPKLKRVSEHTGMPIAKQLRSRVSQCIEEDTREEYRRKFSMYIAGEPEHKRKERLQRVSQRAEEVRSKETEEEKQQRLLEMTANQSKRLKVETEEERMKRLEVVKSNQNRKLERETEEERAKRLEVLISNQKKKLEHETEEERQKRLNVSKSNQKKKMESETEVDKKVRLRNLKSYRKNKKESETEEEKSTRLQKQRSRQQNMIQKETEEAKAKRLQKERLRKKELRQKKSIALKIDHIRANRLKFWKAACDSPSYVCLSCNKLCYATHGSQYIPGEIESIDKMLKSNLIRSAWLCNRCRSSFRKNKIPGNSLENDMKVAPVPEELKGLNSLEERLISRVTPF